MNVPTRARRHTGVLLAIVGAIAALVAGPSIASAHHSRSIVHSFAGNEGGSPNALIQADDGFFYGTTIYGGTGGMGTVFRMDASGNVTVLHSFDRCDPAGYRPVGPLLAAIDGRLYGATVYGGEGNDCIGSLDTRHGSVYSITRDGSNVSVVHTFAAVADGWEPSAGLIQAPSGALFGVTRIGGIVTSTQPQGRGTVYRITASGVFSVLHRLTAPEGQNPVAALLLASDGFLYGTTNEISSPGFHAGGSLFRLHRDGSAFFSVPTPGWEPRGQLVERGGWLYGVTEQGGAYGFGIVYRYQKSTGLFETLFEFGFDGGYATSGKNPLDGLTLARDGNFYGVASLGGLPVDGERRGVVFKMSPTGRLGVLQTFANMTTGFGPYTRLLQATDGDLYGTAMGGAFNQGIVYRVVPDATGELSSLSVYPSELIAGSAVNGTANAWVILDGVAPSTGATVTLTSSKPKIVQVPSSISVAAGFSVGTFVVTTKPARRTVDVTITASYAGVTLTKTIRVFGTS